MGEHSWCFGYCALQLYERKQQFGGNPLVKWLPANAGDWIQWARRPFPSYVAMFLHKLKINLPSEHSQVQRMTLSGRPEGHVPTLQLLNLEFNCQLSLFFCVTLDQSLNLSVVPMCNMGMTVLLHHARLLGNANGCKSSAPAEKKTIIS